MATACIAQVAFGFEGKRKPVVAAFEMSDASSDGGVLLLESVDTHLGLTKRLAGALVDRVTGRPGNYSRFPVWS